MIGAFRKFENAKTFQKIVKREGSVDSKVIQNQRGSWYLIYTEDLDNPEELIARIKVLERLPVAELIVGKPWIFKKKVE